MSWANRFKGRIDRDDEEDPAGSLRIRTLAFYLPQFHPIPENNQWWGEGFTEWTNVTRAQPQFPGHYQPHLPADLGFYDLRLPETQFAQAAMAREYGVYGFCYYHYWFNGKRLLHRPLDTVLRSGAPDFPFCLCWANENWTRAWDGHEREILIEQKYSHQDDLAHIRWLAEVFHDPRYISVDGKPLFLVYRANRFPDARRTTDTWREEAARLGVGELYLCKVESLPDERQEPPELLGFDAAVDFQPDWRNLGRPIGRDRISRMMSGLGLSSPGYQRHAVYDYETVVEGMLRRKPVSYKRYPCVAPSWDNTARRQTGACILTGSTPELYGSWLRRVVEGFQPFGPGEDLIFLNAWNEWAEGNHLEPCQKWGRRYLEATRDVLSTASRKVQTTPGAPSSDPLEAA
ncbi:MAG TPA: glycoside hydrolase family 99-like domain-containing protein [Longimicrobiaceae bacterium]